MSPAPWNTGDQSAGSKWANNFENSIDELVSNVQDSSNQEAMARSLASITDNTPQEVRNSDSFQSWSNSVDSFSEEAIKKAIVAKAQGVSYDEANAADLSSVLDDLSEKYEENFNSAWS